MSKPTTDEIRAFLREEIQDHLCIDEEFGNNTSLRNLGADSLDAAELSVYFEDHFNLNLPPSVHLFDTDRVTINQIVEKIESHL